MDTESNVVTFNYTINSSSEQSVIASYNYSITSAYTASELLLEQYEIEHGLIGEWIYNIEEPAEPAEPIPLPIILNSSILLLESINDLNTEKPMFKFIIKTKYDFLTVYHEGKEERFYNNFYINNFLLIDGNNKFVFKVFLEGIEKDSVMINYVYSRNKISNILIIGPDYTYLARPIFKLKVIDQVVPIILHMET